MASNMAQSLRIIEMRTLKKEGEKKGKKEEKKNPPSTFS